MATAGATRSPARTIIAAMATARLDGNCVPRSGRSSFRAVAYVIPIGDHRRHRKDPFEGIGDLELEVCHRTASL